VLAAATILFYNLSILPSGAMQAIIGGIAAILTGHPILTHITNRKKKDVTQGVTQDCPMYPSCRGVNYFHYRSESDITDQFLCVSAGSEITIFTIHLKFIVELFAQ